ncbi:MAG: nicotinate (nicotinamide) nucleotide adenylyltransferase [Sedimentisphaerales bacterium]|nr:nicotinate (nicotinamide) nucleotide adenylyltransferase [Sedimentisphaerales bacterium]
MVKRKIALFGGTFDPVHIGHTAVAAIAAEHIGAEKVAFVPAKRSPLKNFFPEASDDDRLAMIALAIADNDKFELNDYELRKPKPSYTIETVRYFQGEYGAGFLIYWLLGADSISELSRWYGIIELIDECNLCVMFRGGFSPPDFAKFKDIWGEARVEKLQSNIIRTPLIDISSTEIRNRLASGRDVSGMLTPPVADYIRKHGLYQSETAT